MKFCIVHYNTPELTTCLCFSINKIYNDAEIIVFENSNKKPFINDNIFNNVKIIDNSKGQIINFDEEVEKLISINHLDRERKIREQRACSFFGTFKHSLSVQWLLDNINEDFVLLDSDILLKKPLPELQKTNICIADADKNRILPYIVYFNNNMIKQNNIVFCDYYHILPVREIPQFDTGGYFLQQINNKHLPRQAINFTNYAIHFGNGSWRQGNKANLRNTEHGNYQEFLLKYKYLWD